MVRVAVERSLADLVLEEPKRAAVLERYGLDFCCGGRRSLQTACEERGLAWEEVLAALDEVETAEGETSPCPRHLESASLDELLSHLVDDHHRYLRTELPKIDSRLEKVLVAHGQAFPWLWRFAQTYRAMATELLLHLDKEERVLFPWARRLEEHPPAREGHCGPISQPVRMMEIEHDQVGRELALLRELSDDYALPDQACATWQVLWRQLMDLERDLHLHIHEENNILHPRLLR